MLLSKVLGVIVLARNGDRYSYYQDPFSYAGANTETTALGEVESHALGAQLRSLYFDSRSPSYIEGIRSDLVDNNEVKVRVKAGVEGTVVFDSAVALLQGLFPPSPNNKIVLANETTVVAPLGGYQYVPLETVEPGNDRSLESWTDCPAFAKHVKEFYNSEDFKKKAQQAQPFFKAVKDYVFGRPTTLENAWNIYDFINSQLTHNRTYAHRLPPTFVEQARGWADYHEAGIFSSKEINDIGNIAGRTILHTVLSSLERISFNGDPLQFMLVQTTYQPFISLFHQTGVVQDSPQFGGIPDFNSALAIELRRGSPPDVRDFLRFRFKNGTSGNWEDVHVFGHHADIPLTEFIYRAENAAITSNQQWKQVCSGRAISTFGIPALGFDSEDKAQTAFTCAFLAVGLFALFTVAKLVKRARAKAREARLKLEGDEVSQVVIDYGSIQRPASKSWYHAAPPSPVATAAAVTAAEEGVVDERTYASYFPAHPRWFL
ncbi:phosphoglycerate mutase-like protein [Coprinopsis marcescibilis]|uniref:Phosphoglycerate mutase-like protein n=1 Tax=Coprinopsis marcescibilis TaxID=230819 RepID=A0A5C3KHF2_COPMA|nr:phosphoglycerate mutase-like protein [Coprinopsis marcescibilis]